MNELSILKSISLINRATYQSKQVQERKKSDRIQEESVEILGYDAATGYYKVRNTNGKISLAKSISNSGALSRGTQVSLVTPIGAVPIIDAMPR